MAVRVAILCMSDRWSGPPRTAQALTRAGAEVCIVAPPGSFAAKTRFKFADLLLNARQIKSKLVEICALLADEFQAHSVLAGDDAAFATFAELLASDRLRTASAATQAMLARSMPDPQAAALLSNDSEFILAQCDSPSCPAPRTIRAPSIDEALQFARETSFPVVVKRDGFASGLGVEICEDADMLRAALERAAGRPFVLQQFIKGLVYGATVSGVKGRAMAAIAFEKHRVATRNGATSVARFDPRRDVIAHACGLFEKYGLNGYAGFDYVIDETDQARLIEINPRIMPTGHFDECFGVDLTGAFVAGVSGAPAPAVSEPLNRYVAIFPNEWMRDPDSDFLRTGIHDVPWEDPEVFAAMVDKALAMRMKAEPEPFGDTGRLAMLGDRAITPPTMFGE